MSIIDDALKKAQSNLDKKNNLSPTSQEKQPAQPKTPAPQTSRPAVRPLPQRPSENESSKNKTILISILSLIVLAGALFFILNKTSLKNSAFTKNIPVLKLINNSSKEKPAPSIKPKTKPLLRINYDKNTMILNGTMTIDNKRVALINNNIYKVGDTVNGNEIIIITMERVELRDENGQITRLNVGKK